jgi:hypothetical protein
MYKINKLNDITYDFFENENNVNNNIKPNKGLIYDGGIIHMQYKSYKNKNKLYKNKYYPKSFNKTLKK